jgi:HEAT repeat protein
VPTKTAPIDPELKAALDDATRRFLDPNPEVRRAAVTELAKMKDRQAARLIVGSLADRLKNPNAKVRQAAQDVLVDIGAPAVPVLVARLHRKGGSAVKARVAETLGRIGPRLDGPAFTELFFELEIARGTSPDPATAAACARALARMSPSARSGRKADAAGASPGGPEPRSPGLLDPSSVASSPSRS